MPATVLQEGMNAYGEGILRSACPYEPGSGKSDQWIEGWLAALREDNDAEHLLDEGREADDIRRIERQAKIDLEEALGGVGAEGPRELSDLPQDPER